MTRVITHELNAQPLSGCLDRERVADLLADRPLIFSDTRIFVSAEHLQAMADFVAAMERVTALPGWQGKVLADAAMTARHDNAAHGVFFGYDFHLDATGPRLIEINTNAGGGLLNVLLLQAQRDTQPGLPDATDIERRIVDMFLAEWRAVKGEGAPQLIAIVDDHPGMQYLNPDFALCRDLLQKHGLATVICDPSHLRLEAGELRYDGRCVDLVYNRLTDFFLDHPAHAVLRDAWLQNAAVITPNPRNYALYADKRHLVLLSDDDWLASIGVDTATRALIRRVVPRTEHVTAANADDIHHRRKHLFFKPAQGYGSKAAYRGHNVTTRVFGEIVAHDYVAQEVVPAPTRVIVVEGQQQELKFDLRCYSYRGEVQLTAARLWQGQTTNFRTPGGGFAPVVCVS